MHIAYRVGWPFWKLAAKARIPLQAKVIVTFDHETKTFTAECEDFQPYLGIVTEAETVEELRKKLQDCFYDGMIEAFKGKGHIPGVSVDLTLVAAA